VASFGLGTTSTIDSLVVRWPSGIVQAVVPPPALNDSLTVTETAAALSVEVLAPNDYEIFEPGDEPEIQWSAGPDADITSIDIRMVTDLVLYGTTTSGPGTPSALWTIDPTTGVASSVGAISFSNVGAIAADPSSGILYATGERPAGNVPVLITVDRATGLGTEIGPTGVASNITDLSFDRDTGVLYGHRPQGGAGSITNVYTIDLSTGAASLVGPTERTGLGGALEFSRLNTPYLCLDTQMYRVVTLTGFAPKHVVLVFSAPIDNAPRVKAMSVHPFTHVFYALVEDDDADLQLATIDTRSGAVTNIGGTEAGMDGLTFGPGISTPVATGEANDGAYTWTVPDTPTNACRIEIVAHGSGGNTVTDMSDGFIGIANTTSAEDVTIPAVEFLSAAVPNPFGGATTLRFGLSAPGHARIAIYDARGRRVRELISGQFPAGERTVQWDGRNQAGARVGSGFYVIRLEARGKVFHREVILLR
jgi:hypothetical protein